jgi:hypothetical protein
MVQEDVKVALHSTQYKPLLCLRYVDNIFVTWYHDLQQLQNFHSHLNSLRTSIEFSMEVEPDSAIHFLDVLLIRIETPLMTKVYRNSTHTGRYLNLDSNHPPMWKDG